MMKKILLGKTFYRRLGILLLGVGLSLTQTGCLWKSSYPEGKIEEGIKRICKEEFGIEVIAKVENKTLGVQTFVESLINSDLTRTEEYKIVIENIFLCVRRVCLSTDADIEFFYISCVGKKLGYQAIVSGYIADLRKIMFGGISRDDYFQRMMFEIKPCPKIFGERRIRRLFADMKTKKVDKIIGNNFIRGQTTLRDISSIFFLSLLELNMKDKVSYSILELKSVPTGSDEALFYCKVQEEYSVKPGFESKNFIFPNNFINEYLLVVSVSNFQAVIKKIYPLYKVGGKERVDFPPEYQAYRDINSWKEDDFFIEVLSLPQFLAEQIAKRIKLKVNEAINNETPMEESETKLPPVHIEGICLDDNSTLELTFAWQKDFEEFSNKKNIVDLSFDIFTQVCKKYEFFNFKQIKLIDLTSNNEIGFITVDQSIFKKGNILEEAFNFHE